MRNLAPPRPTPLPVSENAIPQDLKSIRHWVCWEYEYRPSQTKPWTKVPKNPATGKNASNTNPKMWGTFKQAIARYKSQKLDGVGFVLTTDKPYVAIDLDSCHDPETGDIACWAKAIIDRFHSYTEISPSGTGIRIFLRGQLPPRGRKKGVIEVYDTERYMTVTGCHVTTTPLTIEARQAKLEAWHHEVFGQTTRPTHHGGASSQNGHGAPRPLPDDQLIEKALAAANAPKFSQLWAGDITGYPSASEADSALCCLLAFWTREAAQIDALFRRSGLMREKWDERHGEDTYGRITIQRALTVVTQWYTGDAEVIHLTDVGNGLRLVQQFGDDIRYVITWEKWLTWREHRWQIDTGKLIEWHARHVIASLYASAQYEMSTLIASASADPGDRKTRNSEVDRVKEILKWAHDSENGNHIDLMVKRARVNPRVQITHEQLDANPMLFQVANGTIDLTTGVHCASQRSDYLTKHSPVFYNPDAVCPLWDAFLQRIQGYPHTTEDCSPEVRDARIQRADRMIAYLKRLVGMSLTADITAQQLQFLHGSGQNGKSTFLNTILALMGDYGMQAAPNFLLVREHEQHPTELTDLFGKRFVSTIEIEKGKELAEALMKTLTGSEKVRARRMREDFWEFPPTWKVWLAANDQPKVKGRDKATWRRIKLIPFDVTIPDDEVDPDLPQKLLEELPGILNWAIEGCMEWRQQGLQEPEEVTRATEAYREQTDILGQFAKECCVRHAEPRVQAAMKTQSSVLHKAFETYVGTLLSPVAFADVMKASSYKKKTIEGKVYWLGIGLKPPDSDVKAKASGAENEQ